MLNIHTLTLGSYQTNCYIVHTDDPHTCVIIDPGFDAPAILKKTVESGLSVDAILLTHGHFDHVGAVEEIVAATGCKLWMHESDWSQFPSPVTTFFYPLANCDFTEVQFCEDGEMIHAGGLDFQVLHTPGHTPGSVCFLCEEVLFSGDTLFARSCGRTDLPGGDPKQIRESLRRLAGLDSSLTVCPGHAESTTIALEKRYNPFMR